MHRSFASHTGTETPLPEDAALRAIVEGVESETGDQFFSQLVRHLATALACQYSFVTELQRDTRTFRTLAVWGRGKFLDNFEIPLKGTPCEDVLGGQIAHYPEHIQQLFPDDQGIKKWGAESYCGVPLLDAAGVCVGHLAIFDDKPMFDGPRGVAVMRIFAARARAEIERLRVEDALRESEARFRDLYENAPSPIVSSTPEGRFVRWNKRFLEWSGYTAEQMHQLKTVDFWPESAAEQQGIAQVRRRWLNRETFDLEFQVRLAGGRLAWVRGAIRPILDRTGNVVMSEGILIDITEQRLAEKALRESEQRFRDLYENAPSPIVSSTPDGRFVRWNHRFLEWSGYTAEQMRSLSTRDFWPQSAQAQTGIAEVRKRWLNWHRRRASNSCPSGKEDQQSALKGENFEREFQVRLAGGRIAWVRGAIRPLFDGNGNVIMSEGILNDVTEQHRAQEALRVSEDRLSRVIQSAMDAIVTFDADRKIELFNESAEKIFACSAVEAVGGTLDRFLTENFKAALTQSVHTAAAGTQEHPYVFSAGGLTARRATGVEFPLEATISHVEVGGRSLFTLIVRDIDERRRAESELRALSLQNEYLQEEIKETHNFEEIIGRSASLASVLEKVRLVAATDSSVLILGETGTGKELVSRAVHSNSARKERPFIKVNCAALPTGLIESELFGHEKGAFTGATEKRIGRFELANGGTIFLDEIGEVPPELQVKLLRVLQEHEFERIGGSQTIKVDVRVIAATNRDLACEVAEGTFRQDLYYRLNVFPLRIPPLRERPEDIGLLVHYFVRRYATKIGRKITRVPTGTMERLATYPWPGNVRELENVVERAVILSPGPDLEIGPEIFAAASAVAAQSLHKPDTVEGPPRAATNEARDSSGSQSLREIERSHIVAILRQTKWRIDGPNGAAQKLHLNSSTLRSRMKKLGIRRDDSDI